MLTSFNFKEGGMEWCGIWSENDVKLSIKSVAKKRKKPLDDDDFRFHRILGFAYICNIVMKIWIIYLSTGTSKKGVYFVDQNFSDLSKKWYHLLLGYHWSWSFDFYAHAPAVSSLTVKLRVQCYRRRCVQSRDCLSSSNTTKGHNIAFSSIDVVGCESFCIFSAASLCGAHRTFLVSPIWSQQSSWVLHLNNVVIRETEKW